MLLKFIACIFLAGCSAAPPNEPYLVIKESFFKSKYLLYTGKHDIVRIFVPLHQFKLDIGPSVAVDQDSSGSSSSSEETKPPFTLFFVEGDYKNDEVINKGLYIFTKGKATKLLENGRDAVATQANTIYLGGKDGIYKYDNATNTATKHGTVTDSIIQFAYNNKTDSIYYLTDDNEVYKLNEDATASVKVPGLTDVQQIAIGYEGSLYYNSAKEFYVVKLKDGGVPRKVTGLPENWNKIVLAAPFYETEVGVLLYVDNDLYILEEVHSRKGPIRTEAIVTAQSSQYTFFHFFGKDKKMYVFHDMELFYLYRNPVSDLI
ncbi:uncharacterized protein [Choristoneura fumiferana]|uniref:uncharacterized protein n=1 Tax=Choristoneura fumiferana TaxID=7141 RepID=UPI003D158395